MITWMVPRDPVAAQTRKPEALGNDTLTGECGIAVQQQRQNLHPFRQRHDFIARQACQQVLLGARLAHHDRVDDLQVGRVGRQRQVDRIAVELTVRRCTQMVFHIARSFDLVRRIGTALELVEDRPVGFSHDLGQHIEAAAVRHSKDDFLQPHLSAALDDLLQRRDQRFAAVQAEALCALVLDVDELLEAFRFHQLLQDRDLATGGKLDTLVRSLDAFLDPGLFLRVGDMHELHADGRAIGAAQDVDHFPDRRVLQAEHIVEEDPAVQVGLRKAVVFRRQFVVVLFLLGNAERIEIGVQVAAHAVGADHHDRPYGIACRLLHLVV